MSNNSIIIIIIISVTKVIWEQGCIVVGCSQKCAMALFMNMHVTLATLLCRPKVL